MRLIAETIMKAMSNICLSLRSALLGLAVLFVGHSALGQTSSASSTIRDGETAVSSDPSGTPRPQTDAEPQPDAPKTVYSKFGTPESAPTNPYGTVHRSRITYGKRSETMVVKESNGTNGIRKTKDGSSDATVPTGKFKGSLLDIGLPAAPAPAASPALDATSLPKSTPAALPRFSASPGSSPELKPVTAPQLDITLGTAPAARPAPSPSR